jgi:hypothetical protein
MMETTVSVDKTFWTRPALGFRVMEPMLRSKITRLKERTGKFLDKSSSTATRLHLPSVQKDETVILFSETLMLELERRGIALSLPEHFAKGGKRDQRFYYYAAPDTIVRSTYSPDGSVRALDKRFQFKQAIALSRFEAPATNLLNLMMKEPAEPGVTPELRMKELSGLMRSVNDERFTRHGSYMLDATITTLCGLEIDAAMKTEWFDAAIAEVAEKNGWVKQFPAEKAESSGA